MTGYPELRGRNAFESVCEECDGTGEAERGWCEVWSCLECDGTGMTYWDDEQQALWEDACFGEEETA